jgi:hypothetical protein
MTEHRLPIDKLVVTAKTTKVADEGSPGLEKGTQFLLRTK